MHLVPVDLDAGGPDDVHQQRGVDTTGADGVDPDAPVPVVDRHALGEHDDATLRGVVGAAPFRALDPLDRGDVDDGATVRLEHVDGGVLVDQEGALQVDVHHPVPLGLLDQMDRAPSGHAGAVDDRVESAVGADHLGKGIPHGGLVPHVEHVVDPAGDVDGRHRRALRRQPVGGGRPDARGAPCDHGHRSVQSFHRRSPYLSSESSVSGAVTRLRSPEPTRGRSHGSRTARPAAARRSGRQAKRTSASSQ